MVIKNLMKKIANQGLANSNLRSRLSTMDVFFKNFIFLQLPDNYSSYLSTMAHRSVLK